MKKLRDEKQEAGSKEASEASQDTVLYSLRLNHSDECGAVPPGAPAQMPASSGPPTRYGKETERGGRGCLLVFLTRKGVVRVDDDPDGQISSKE